MVLGWTAAELDDRMSAYELAQKEILEVIDPWGPKRGDYRAAVIAWSIANSFGGKTKFNKVLKMFDFEDSYEQTDAEIGRMLDMMGGQR